MSQNIETDNHFGQIENSTLGMEQRKLETKKNSSNITLIRLSACCSLDYKPPLGISCQYLERVKQELNEYYKELLKRKFIEATYY